MRPETEQSKSPATTQFELQIKAQPAKNNAQRSFNRQERNEHRNSLSFWFCSGFFGLEENVCATRA